MSARVSTADKNKLFKAALKVRNNSYSPYSKCKVAAAVLTSDGRLFTGVNVENASYGATICAERSAIFGAITAGAKKITAILVMTDAKEPWPPCGMCRQVIAEFATSTTIILLANLKGVRLETTMAELLPFAFDKSHLV